MIRKRSSGVPAAAKSRARRRVATKCRHCGRFMRPLYPDDVHCNSDCFVDERAKRERWERASIDNRKALAAMAAEVTP